jgi:8-oxo-dGTP diphosphatase
VHRQPIPCVGAIITGPGGRLLLIKRGHEPEAGRWSLPGGRIEPGETDQQALVREVREETGLEVAPGRLVGEVERPSPGGRVLVIRDYAAAVTGGALAAGDDAADARWAGPADLQELPLTSGLEEALYAWGVLPLAPSAAVVAEATRRAGVVWLTVPPSRTAYPVWHIWRAVEAAGQDPPPPGAAYLVTGPGEQPAPGLGAAGQVTVTVPSKDSGGTLVTWTAGVRQVEPGSAEWDAVIGPLVAGRLNSPADSSAASPAARWARSCAVFCLVPVCS